MNLWDLSVVFRCVSLFRCMYLYVSGCVHYAGVCAMMINFNAKGVEGSRDRDNIKGERSHLYGKGEKSYQNSEVK